MSDRLMKLERTLNAIWGSSQELREIPRLHSMSSSDPKSTWLGCLNVILQQGCIVIDKG